MASSPEQCKEKTTEIVEKLITLGWDIVSDQHLDARVRVWLPEKLNSTPEVAVNLEHEQLAGILVFTESTNRTLVVSVIEPTQSTLFSLNTKTN